MGRLNALFSFSRWILESFRLGRCNRGRGKGGVVPLFSFCLCLLVFVSVLGPLSESLKSVFVWVFVHLFVFAGP